MSQETRTVVIRLTPKEADLVNRNADGWLDAGACEDGLEADERAALHELCEQITDQIWHGRKPKRASKKP
jgi:hypothetical protein